MGATVYYGSDQSTRQIQEVSQMSSGDDEDTSVDAIRVRYDDIKDDDRQHLEQFVRDQESWKAELG